MTINLSADHILENENVLLRPLLVSDFENLLEFSEKEQDLWKFSLLTAAGKENMKQYLQTALDGRSQKKEYPFIIYDKRKNSYAGSTRFYDILPDYKTLQLGFTWYGKQFQGTGLNKNCKYLLLEFAFEKWQVERVEFRADNDNARSIAAMKSIGCKIDGVLRSNMPKRDGGRRDSIILSILNHEWKNEVKEMLGSKLKSKN
ncbi:MAG: GNAT family N-acetyltransferase [Segetibacter sp.]|nr:GNAT family N-acetyltransferase [Segetibacter sp.]